MRELTNKTRAYFCAFLITLASRSHRRLRLTVFAIIAALLALGAGAGIFGAAIVSLVLTLYTEVLDPDNYDDERPYDDD